MVISSTLRTLTYIDVDGAGVVQGNDVDATGMVLLISVHLVLSGEYSAASAEPRLPLLPQVIVVGVAVKICEPLTPSTFTLNIDGPVFFVMLNVPLSANVPSSSDRRMIPFVVEIFGTDAHTYVVAVLSEAAITDHVLPPSAVNSNFFVTPGITALYLIT